MNAASCQAVRMRHGVRRKWNMETAKVALPISGDKLYQQRARTALPILVRQAHANTLIFYSDLALELKMSNPRNLNYVLGSIGQTLKDLSKEWQKEIPPIQCLVINKNTGLPGKGVGWFITDKENFGKLPNKQKRRLVEAELQKIFAYQNWQDILKVFSLKRATISLKDPLQKATHFQAGVESEHHKKLKNYVANHPDIVLLHKSTPKGQIEYPLPSGDSLDVFFVYKDIWVGIEVKSHISIEADIIRGIFQCVKYQAVLEAYQASQQLPQKARAILVLENAFPDHLIPLKHMLGVEIFDNVKSE